MDEFLVRALAGGTGVALAAGPLGAFIVWRRMAYFGDTLAHSGLLGVALGAVLGINPGLGVVLTCLVVALVLVLLQRRHALATDTLLGILAHTTLSLGLVTLAFLETVRIDLTGYLFGDILSIGTTDLYWIWGGNLLALGVLAGLWRPLLAATVHEELARVEGVSVFQVRLAFMLLIAIVIAVAMKVVGILLITSLLIIPAATARRFARSPESMAALASLIGCLAIGFGLWASLRWDTPAGPSVVVAATSLFALGSAIPNRWPR
ncbi:MAG: zinc ABC transporter permease subunit ZnuB [Candidatus Competibacteraceae bacterium]|nr:zinc ABC transporter permease subunit ZnuB [Candidatus Competibacteraceae bacterium]MBK7983616.1 zinc ABC transporter permease subunit ZnuB [Candidatus Competibacteraceae bacterium]MBK8897844.1 zinc ABC transporter permease subunit ZnuB [Candidatus Competibacteraceae bacterium]MBK8961647.1 zinc ABC transporter permease subunit ZnuB [Candidatus Competibacteraceae bacterium]MBK9950869.1 zinc ABC transporter permease subunit ZnuB [Candidatus Competibacteraceae bacterium]